MEYTGSGGLPRSHAAIFPHHPTPAGFVGCSNRQAAREVVSAMRPDSEEWREKGRE